MDRFILLFVCFALYIHMMVTFVMTIHMIEIFHEEDQNITALQLNWGKKIEKRSAEAMWRDSIFRAITYTFGSGNTIVWKTRYLIIDTVLCFFSFIVVTIIAVQVIVCVRNFHATRVVYEDMENHLREYLKHKRVPRALYHRICQYYHFCFEQRYYEESSIMSFISGQLKQEVLLHKSRRLLETVAMFRNMPPRLSVRLVAAMTEQVALRNEVVMKIGYPSTHLVYILSGTVAIYGTDGHEVCHLKEGDHFGCEALVESNMKAKISVVAVETTRLWTLRRDAFRDALAVDPVYMHHLLRSLRRDVAMSEAEAAADSRESRIADYASHLRQRRHKEQRQQELRSMQSLQLITEDVEEEEEEEEEEEGEKEWGDGKRGEEEEALPPERRTGHEERPS